MTTKLLVAGLMASAMLTAPAFAQSNPPVAPAPAASTMAPMSQSGEWRSSKLIGVNVYNEQNDKLGDINDIILDKSGKVDGVVLAVGGFLGMGEHYVKVSMDKLQFTDQPVKSSTATTGANTTTANDRKWYPDHAVLNTTKDQLKAMPQFKY